MQRRTLLGLAAGWAGLAADPGAVAASAVAPDPASRVRPRTLIFPADFGAHPETRTEWWYVTGELHGPQRTWGFQVTFFRTATGVPASHPSRFAASQLVFAHAAVSDLQSARLRHDQRIARAGFGIAAADSGETRVVLRDWRLEREATAAPSRYRAEVASASAGFELDLRLTTTQPLLLQGEAGYSRKGPQEDQASLYYSQPQLAVEGSLVLEGTRHKVAGRAWLDHEWCDTLLDPTAVGWDWIGMNLDDGSALTAFRLRRADGSALFAGGSFRPLGQGVRNFGPDEVRFEPGRIWESGTSRARYPVEWAVATPAGQFRVRAVFDDQELDSRGSTGSIYWEGLSDLFDASGVRVGRGYLELTGYAAALRL